MEKGLDIKNTPGYIQYADMQKIPIFLKHLIFPKNFSHVLSSSGL